MGKSKKKATGDEERWDGAARRWVLHGAGEGRSVVWCFFRRGERGLERNWSGREPVLLRVHSPPREERKRQGKPMEDQGQATRPQSLISRGATHRRSNQHQRLDTGTRCRPGGRRQRQKGGISSTCSLSPPLAALRQRIPAANTSPSSVSSSVPAFEADSTNMHLAAGPIWSKPETRRRSHGTRLEVPAPRRCATRCREQETFIDHQQQDKPLSPPPPSTR